MVLGGSLAGLTTARALSNHYSRVTVVERDERPPVGEPRKGAPQGRHAHGLLASGYRQLDAYYPGLFDEIVELGGRRGDVNSDFLWHLQGHWKLRTGTGLAGAVMSRPLLESIVAKYTAALPGVTLLEGYDAEQPEFSGGRVTAVRVMNRVTGEAQELEADLVVDATGRGSQAPRWLKQWGFGDVAESEVRIDMGYATTVFERKAGDLFGADGGAIIAGTVPQGTRFGTIIRMEGERWMVTLGGTLGDYPSTELAEWRAFAEDLATHDIANIVRVREPLREIVSYRYTASQRRHFDRMKSFPEGFLVIGDALCSFNPVYGQGMSVAVLEAKALDDCLAQGDGRLWARFFKRAHAITETPWVIATGEDLKYPQVAGKRPRGFRLINSYMARVQKAATKDPVVLRQFFLVLNLLAPPSSLMSPPIAWRVLMGGRGEAQPLPVSADAAAEAHEVLKAR
jgi:2-polyprenyl-6-methoxyphenol hydroxylase-like FAD-dependent oxidoreductase